MREHGIAGYRRRRRVAHHDPRTGRPEGARPAEAGLHRPGAEPALRRRHHLPAARRRQNLYLATVIDCYSRRLVGWAVADHMRTELVEDALTAAAATRGSLAGAIFHSDHGSVYTSKDYAQLCAELGVTQSMGAVGTSADNASPSRSTPPSNARSSKTQTCWPDELTCRRQVFRWLTRYNTRRRHSWCRYQSPIAYETLTAATLPSAA